MDIIFHQILESFQQNNLLDKIIDKKIHLGIFTKPYLSLMLDGRKTIESRFSKKKIIPYNSISKDDIVLMKKVSDKIIAYFEVKEVKFFDFTKTKIDEIKYKYQDQLCLDENFWEEKKDSKFATLIFIKKIHLISPFSISKKGMQSWIIFNNERK